MTVIKGKRIETFEEFQNCEYIFWEDVLIKTKGLALQSFDLKKDKIYAAIIER